MKKFIIFWVIFFNLACVYPQQWKTLDIDGKISKINILTLGTNDYINLSTISKNFFPDSKLYPTKFTIEFNNKFLRFAPSSVFSALLSQKDSIVFQMRQPAIIYQNQLLIPYNSFLLSLEIFQLYKVDIYKNELKLTKYLTPVENNDLTVFKNKLELINQNNFDEKQQNQKEKTPQPEGQKITPKKNEDKITMEVTEQQENNFFDSIQNETIESEDINISPNSYKLPKDLNRGDLSEIAQNIIINDNELFITNYFVELNKNTLTFALAANNIIEQYQKPEVTNNKVLIKIPNAKNGIVKFTNLTPIINKIENKRINDMLVYIMELNKNFDSFDIRRNGPKELILTIHFKENNL